MIGRIRAIANRRAWARKVSGGKVSGIKVLIVASLFLSAISSSLAQIAPIQLRRIAPNTVPDYRGVQAEAPETLATMPEAGRPFGSCERGGRRVTWLLCLRTTSDLTDQKVSETAGLVQLKLDEKAGTAGGRKRFLARALDQAQEQWRSLRNHECQQLAAAEPALVSDAYEARLMCLIRSDMQRMADLRTRYQLAP